MSRADPMRGPRARSSGACGLVLATLIAGCLPSRPLGQLTVWAVGDLECVSPDEAVRKESECYDHQHNRIVLRAARNEVVACQLVLRTDAVPLDRVTVGIGPLTGRKGKVPQAAVRAFRPITVRAGRVASWSLIRPEAPRVDRPVPDVLVPLDAPSGGQPFQLPANTALPIWIDVDIGEAVEPDVYTGEIDIDAGGSVVERVGLHVEVLGFALPAPPQPVLLVGVHMPTLFRHHLERDGKPHVPSGVVSGDPVAPEAAAVIDQTVQLLRAHRCRSYLTGVYPSIRFDEANRMQIAWEDYDRTVAACMGREVSAGPGRSVAWPIPVDESFPPPAAYGGVDSPAYGAALREYLRQCAAHFSEKGWLDGHFVSTRTVPALLPEPPESVKTFGSLVRRADARLRLLTTAIPQSMKPYGWTEHAFDSSLPSVVSIWAPPAQFYDPVTMDQQRALGRATWMTVGDPPFSPSLEVGAPAVDPAALAWQIFRYHIDGVVVPSANDWPDDPLGAPVPSGARWLIYPGKAFGVQGPVPSIRLKQLRRGLQDLEYLFLLKRHDQGPLAETMARVLFRYGGSAAYEDHFADGCQWPWVEQAALWDLARRLMADRLAQVAAGAPSDSFEPFAQTVAWRRLIDAACAVRVLSLIHI